MNKNDRASLNAVLKSAVASIEALQVEYQDTETSHRTTIGRLMTRFALALWQGQSAKLALGHDQKSVKTWRESQGKGFGSVRDDGSFGDLAPPSLYRYLNAGRVAESIGVESIGNAVYTSLVPLYRVLAESDKSDDAEASTVAVSDMQAIWQGVSAGVESPSFESVLQAVESFTGSDDPKAKAKYPATRGKVGASASTRKAKAKAKTARTRQTPNTPTETTENGGQGNVESIKIDAAAVESAGKIVASMAANLARTQKIEAAAVRACMLATVRLCREHGADTIAATLLTPADAGK